ncbi:PIN domain-containing protein [Nocardia amamiensis]|uniref:PIN domain-containing protein n=1 Tax=Nocardia amamiensis TaxID=404578 RepID=UPI00082D16F7|nr:PIN domain-containing protein [Nocardia amamiensis]
MTIIVFDTNMLVNSPRLRSPEWVSLIRNKDEWSLRLVVPEVAFMETVNVVRRHWQSEIGNLLRVKVGEFGLAEQRDSMLAEIRKAWEEYERWLRDFLHDHDVVIEPPPPADLMELARRASETRAPYSESRKKDGLRDTLIWLTVMAVARQNLDEQVWFVSDNHNDFGQGGIPNTDDHDDCSMPFHQHLVEDLGRYNLAERVRYVNSLRRLEQHLAAQYAPVPDAVLVDLVDNLDKNLLTRRLAASAPQLVVDPEQAALPLQVAAAQITGVRERDHGWEFSEGARRGEAGWTARFSVESEVDLSMIEADQTFSETTKLVRLLGDVAVASDGTIRDLVVSSAEALPDDPMRAPWVSRRSRVGSSASFSGVNSVIEGIRRSQDALASPILEGIRRSQDAVASPILEEIRRSQSALASPILEEIRRTQQTGIGSIFEKTLSSQVPEIVDGFEAPGLQTDSFRDERSTDSAEETAVDADDGITDDSDDADDSESGS